MGSKLYCGDCGDYLMAGDGECHDCSCGWKQPVKNFDLKCWACDEGMAFYERSENDGFCIHCQAEIELD